MKNKCDHKYFNIIENKIIGASVDMGLNIRPAMVTIYNCINCNMKFLSKNIGLMHDICFDSRNITYKDGWPYLKDIKLEACYCEKLNLEDYGADFFVDDSKSSFDTIENNQFVITNLKIIKENIIIKWIKNLWK